MPNGLSPTSLHPKFLNDFSSSSYLRRKYGADFVADGSHVIIGPSSLALAQGVHKIATTLIPTGTRANLYFHTSFLTPWGTMRDAVIEKSIEHGDT